MTISTTYVVAAVLATIGAPTRTVPAGPPAKAAAPPLLAQVQVRVQNDIKDCIGVAPEAPFEMRNLLLLPAVMTWKKNVGACGCTSAVLSYRVNERIDRRYSHEVVRGELIDMSVAAPGTGVSQFTFVLKTDRRLTGPKQVQLTFGCEGPD